MLDKDDSRDGLKLADRATLSLLSVIENDESQTQRSLAQSIGVALGMTNSLLKRAVRKGLVKVKNAPAKRYVYYVTPKGFSEKSRLVAEYLSTSLMFFRRAREEYKTLFDLARENGHDRIALCGVGELAEIAMMSAQQSGVELYGVIDAGSNQPHFVGIPIYASLEMALNDGVEVVVITTSENPQALYEDVIQHVDPDRVYAVPLLHISRNGMREKRK